MPGRWFQRILAAYVCIAVAFLLLPELIVVGVSFNPTSRMVMSWTEMSLRWYAALVEDRSLLNAFGYSLGLAIFVTLCSTLLGGLVAYWVARHGGRFAAIVTATFVAPLVIPATALGVALFMFLNRLGFTDSVLGLVAGHILVTLPYTFRTLLAAIAGVDRALEEAALSLGATRTMMVRRVILPLIRPGFLAAALFSMIVSIEEFTISLFVGGRNAGTIPLEIYNATEYGLTPIVAAVSTLLIAVSSIAIIVLDKSIGLNAAYSVRR
ncbi:ABC transporter permease [Bosea sp. (in: a-proteobacteria)]|uniref:ABC transporter permease n=1 Tax=Bosea sp. (in: a-proteobacteria) TaxID=1871050 RepID=UPI00260CC1FC|nr:ABC transporter permease [Bosea sp. (in: a-proteobacteria)]MCO5089830.1 ABC transporter permease [Bosea sp. (in: a-proteobacteria)]